MADEGIDLSQRERRTSFEVATEEAVIEDTQFERRLGGVLEGDRPVAFLAYDLQNKHGGRVGYILELLHLPGHGSAARRLLRLATRELYVSGAEVVLSWCLEQSPNRSVFMLNGFVPLPERLRPIELHAGVRPLATQESDVAIRSSWYLSYVDSDTV